MKCLNCPVETTNPKFCSQSCAASYNNKLYPKKKRKIKLCAICSEPVDNKSIYCIKHKSDGKNLVYTISDAINAYSKHHRSSAFALIRSRARAVAIKFGINSCQNCGYDKHIEVCHKKPISSFPIETFINVVNDMSNLLFLCPNCHWEFDNKIIVI
jgi:5-methylcytosine-specific restriction endonuclease McrA